MRIQRSAHNRAFCTRVRVLLLCFISVICVGSASAEPNSQEQNLIQKYPQRIERLFESLNLDYPGLQEVKHQLEEGKREQALVQFLQYHRKKYLSDALYPALLPPRPDIIGLADDANQDLFTIQSKTYQQPERAPGLLDWEDLGPNHDKDWAWMLNRHPHFEFLVTAYQSTHNPSYLETISRHLVDWIPFHPPPDHVSFSTSWRALEAARRIMDSWLLVYSHERSEAALSDEALLLMISAIPEHANYLRNHYSFWGGNHKMTEKMAIAVCALAWPEFKESKEWLEGALEVISEELFDQTYSDGSYKELANHYQKVVAENYLRLLKMLDDNELVSVNSDFRARVEALWNYFAYVTKPSGFGPLNNDSSREDNFHYLAEANQYFNRLDWKYILTHGAEGHAPSDPFSRYYPMAGQAIMRNAWDADAHWAFFDMGPHGSAHQHWDRLHLSVSVGQRDVLVDSGRYVYKPGPIRDFFRYGVGHNVVRVDQQDSIRPPNSVSEPMQNLVQIEGAFDAFGATVRFKTGSLGSEQVKLRRVVVYVRDQGWLIMDEVVGFGSHMYDTLWNFHPDCLVTRNGDALTVDLGEGSLAVLRLLNTKKRGTWDLARGQMELEIRGWYSWAYNERLPSTSARYRYTKRQPHVNVWWLSPLVNSDDVPVGAHLLNSPRSMEQVEVEIDRRSGASPRRFIRWENGKVVLDEIE